MVKLLRYDYDKHGIPVDREGWFKIADIVTATPLRHFQTSQVLERLAGEPQRFSVNGQKVRVHFENNRAFRGLRRRDRPTQAAPPDLERSRGNPNRVTFDTDNKTNNNDVITLMADTSKTNVDTMTKLIQTDKGMHADFFLPSRE